jgi:hypothetical protein
MSHFTEDPEELLRVLLPLDGGAGPARRISRQKAFELVRLALDAAREAQPFETPESSIRRVRARENFPSVSRFLRKL